MAAVHELTRADARRLAVRAQWLTAERPAGVVETVDRLSLLQLDPTRAIAPSAELVVWSRLGSSFSTQELWDAVDELRLVQLHGMLRPAADIALFRAEMEMWREGDDLTGWRRGQVQWVRDNDAFRMDLLDLLRSDGPLTLKDLPDTCVRPWESSGWNDNKNVQMMLNQLVKSGEVAVAGGMGRHRLWDLASRVYPDDEVVPLEESLRRRDARRLRALGIARARAPETMFEPLGVADAGEPAVVEGVKGEWRVDPALLDLPFSGRTALLSPFDRLLQDRRRVEEIFEFDYVLEMYKPEAKRRWGYYALPILHGDRLVGKLDAKADRRAGVLEVYAVHEDEPFTAATRAAVDAEIDDLARWLDLEVERVAKER